MNSKYIFSLTCLLFVGCSSSTTVESTTNANGQERHIINCRDTVTDCYGKASELCPDGYLVTNRVRGVRKDDHTEFELRVRCRSGKIFY